ncbi:uncharacterized protein [Lepisosteus oculatus]|nr:PREDICTED: uncharacterized protein LOC107079430 isoform X2 [Lepisosteus oculatus]
MIAGQQLTRILKNTTRKTMFNLTSHLRDLNDFYKFGVQAFSSRQTSNWTVSNVFQPLSQTILGPPDVSLTGCGDCLLLEINIPREVIFKTSSLEDIYVEINFTVKLKKHGKSQESEIEFTNNADSTYKISQLEPAAQYCLKVKMKTTLNQNTLYSGWHCEFTGSKEPSKGPYVLGTLPIALVLCGVTVSALMYVCCICKTRHPWVLASFKGQDHSDIIQMFFTAEQHSISFVTFYSSLEKKDKINQNLGESSDSEDTDEGYDGYENRKGGFSACTNTSNGPESDIKSILAETNDDSGQGAEPGCCFQYPCVNVAGATNLGYSIHKSSPDVSKAEISEPLGQSGLETQKPETECKDSREEAEISLAVNLFSVKLGSQDEAFSMTFQAGAIEDQEQQLEDELIQSPVRVEAVDWGTQEPNTEPSKGPAQTYCADSEDEEEDEDTCVYMRRPSHSLNSSLEIPP